MVLWRQRNAQEHQMWQQRPFLCLCLDIRGDILTGERARAYRERCGEFINIKVIHQSSVRGSKGRFVINVLACLNPSVNLKSNIHIFIHVFGKLQICNGHTFLLKCVPLFWGNLSTSQLYVTMLIKSLLNVWVCPLSKEISSEHFRWRLFFWAHIVHTKNLKPRIYITLSHRLYNVSCNA